MAQTTTLYQLKVTLKEIKPPIWRRLQVPAGITLAGLHYAIADSFGWNNSHLHQFVIDDRRFGMQDADEDLDMEDEKKFKLDRLTVEGARFDYDYDFGDGWEHQVVVEKVLPAESGLRYPTCLTGKRACPPDDCGGPGGYADFAAAAADPAHPRRAELTEWMGEAFTSFDPERFDRAEINSRLGEGYTRSITEKLV